MAGGAGVPRNKLKRALREGRIATVLAGHSGSADTIDFVGPLGFDGFWLEGEHGPLVWDRLGDLSRACDLWGMAALVRVRALEESLIVRALSLGAHGVVVPLVRTRADAEHLVAAAKFAPIGHRGVTRGRRSYGNPDFLQTDNDETVLVVQLEDPEALANAEAIAGTPHLDVAMVALNDLAQAMGHQGQPDHPEVVAAIDDAVGRIARAGGAAPGVNCAADRVAHYAALGARFFYTTYDPWIAAGALAYQRAVASAQGAAP